MSLPAPPLTRRVDACPLLVLELVYPGLPQLINLLYVTALQDWTEGRTPSVGLRIKIPASGNESVRMEVTPHQAEILNPPKESF